MRKYKNGYSTEGGEQNQNEKSTEQTNNITSITTEELNGAIGKLQIGKAAGYDEITPEMINYLDDTGKEVFKDLLNSIIKGIE